MATLQWDHAVQFVNQPEAAIEIFAGQQLRAVAGGRHPGCVVVKFFWTRRSDGRVMHRRATGRQGWPAFRTVRVIGSQVLNAIGYCYKS